MLKTFVSFALEASLFVLVLSIGLQSRWSDLTHVIRKPALLLRAIVAVNVIVPAVAVILCLVLPVAPWTKAGLVMMAASPLAPFAPLKMLKTGSDRSYVVGAYVALMLAAVVLVPLTAVVLRPLTPHGVTIPVPVIVAFVVQTVLVPLMIGVAINGLSQPWALRAAPIARKAALAILIPVALLIAVRFAPGFVDLVGDGTLATIAATVGAGLAAGHALGGPDVPGRSALGEAAATRHPGLAAAIAQLHSNDPRILQAIVLFLFAGILFSAGYAQLLSRLSRRRSATAQIARSNLG